MRVLWQRPGSRSFLIKWLRQLVTHLQFATIFPLAVAIIICYPFFLSLREDPRPCILLHQAYPRQGASLANMRQAIIVPPVFVNALDPKITEIIGPLKRLHDDIARNGANSSARLYSMFDVNNTAPISQYVAPTSSNVQGLLFTYVYQNEKDGDAWDAALNEIANKTVQVPPANVVDRQELEEAEISTASSAHYSLWPGASGLSQLIIGVFGTLFVWYSLLWVHSTSVYRPWIMVLSICCRVAAGVFSALSVVSFLYPTFNTLVLSRFLWIIIMATYVGLSNSTQVIDAAEQQQLAASQSALNRLYYAYKQSDKSVFEVMSVQLSLAVLSVVCMYFTKQSTLLPLTAFMITFLTIDTALHYSFFAAILYIDMVGLEMHDFACVERPSSRRKTFLRKICDSYLSCLIQAIAYNFDLVVYLPIITYLVFHCNGGYFLNKIHPHIKHALSHPKYIDSFVNPLDKGLRSYSYLKIYRPVVFSIGGHFGTPSTKIDFTVSTLRYGNVVSMMLEMFCLLIFFSSVCMIALILLTDQQKLSSVMKLSSKPDSEVFSEVTVDVNSRIDVVKATSDEQYICVLSLDGQISVVDVSAFNSDSRKLFVIPTTQNSWSVQNLLLNSRQSLVGAVYRTHVDLWNIVTGQKYYELDYSQVVDAPHLVSAFIKSSLLFIARAGRLIEVHTNQSPQVYHLSKKPLRWAIVHLGVANLNKAVLCDVDNQLYLCKRSVVDDKVEWKSRPLQLSKAFLVDHGIVSIEPNSAVPSFQGMLPLPVPWTEKYDCDDDIIDAISVPDLQLWVAFTAGKAMFIDLQSGVILKIVTFDNCKPGTAQAFHSQPTHCAFCGCIAISSFTIAYEALNNPGKLVCETWQIPNKSRNSICLRIERDPHETRCRGFMATEATEVSISRVKTWAPTKINMIMGIRERASQSRSSSSGVDALEWEAFAISAATGVTSSFDLNESALDTQLMTSSPGQAVPLGAKSVCVPFGNVVKILYLQQ